MKYCIIGGGFSGVGLGKTLRMNGFDVTIYEKEDDFGGNWYFGKPCSKMYDSVHTISSKINTQFSDYPMPQSYPSYLNHKLMLRYLQDVARHYCLYDCTQFNTSVVNVEVKNNQFTVQTDHGQSEDYDVVIIANGLYRKPHLPNYPGEYPGKTLHSIEYIHPDIMKNKKILVVGAGNTGCDIVVDAVHYAHSITHSMRRAYYFMPKFIAGKPTQEWLMSITKNFSDPASYWQHVKDTFKLVGCAPEDYGLPKPEYEINQCHPTINPVILNHYGQGDIEYKPDIASFDGDQVIFKDGSKGVYDLLIYATGYEKDLGFLSQDFYNPNGELDLYVHMFHKHFNNLIFMGYVNAPSGLGNLINAGCRLLVAYFKALERNAPSIKIFDKVKHGAAPDLGNDQFIKTRRHAYELDLWKLIKVMNKLTEKFATS